MHLNPGVQYFNACLMSVASEDASIHAEDRARPYNDVMLADVVPCEQAGGRPAAIPQLLQPS